MGSLQPSILTLKAGVTLALDVLVADDNGQPVDLSGSTVVVVIADLSGTQLAALPVAASAEQGWGTIVAATTGWPIGRLAAEVQVTTSGTVSISDSFAITVRQPVTAA